MDSSLGVAGTKHVEYDPEVGIELLTERHKGQIEGALGCWDRVLVFGTLPKICFAEGMTSYLFSKQVRIFDYPKFAEPFRNELRENAERLAAANRIEIEFIRKRNVRKEERVKEILSKRGEQVGLVCIFSGMEPCSTYKPWHNKQTRSIPLRRSSYEREAKEPRARLSAVGLIRPGGHTKPKLFGSPARRSRYMTLRGVAVIA